MTKDPLVLDSRSAEQTRRFGAALAHALRKVSASKSVVIALNGELGAGKTTLIGGLLHAFGVTGAVRSPTYTLLEPYELAERSLYHLDLYRIADPRELEMLALRDLLNAGAVLLVEWAVRGGNALPAADLTLTLKYRTAAAGEQEREIELLPGSPLGNELALSVQESTNETNVSP